MWLIRWWGATPVRFLALVALTAGSLWAVVVLGSAFATRTGSPTPDTQNRLTVQAAAGQIQAWTPADAAAYAWFAVVDLVFPLAAALVLAVVAHRAIAALPRTPPRLALLCLLPAAADYGENVAFLVAAASGAAAGPIQAALAFKSVKLVGIAGAGCLVGVLVLAVLARWVARRGLSRRGPAAPGRAAAVPRSPAA